LGFIEKEKKEGYKKFTGGRKGVDLRILISVRVGGVLLQKKKKKRGIEKDIKYERIQKSGGERRSREKRERFLILHWEEGC